MTFDELERKLIIQALIQAKFSSKKGFTRWLDSALSTKTIEYIKEKKDLADSFDKMYSTLIARFKEEDVHSDT